MGVIGTGRIADFVHLPSLRLCPDLAEVTAVASRDPARAKAFAERWGIPRVHAAWEALVADPELDAVVICPPSDLNFAVASAAVAAGKHVLCEKPLALTHPEARSLAAAADRAGGRVHMVAFTFRFAAALRYLKRLVDEGHFGEIRHWRMSYFTDGQVDPATPFTWRHQRARGGAGVIADMGSHMIDAARYLLGDIAAVSATTRTLRPRAPRPGRRARPGGGSRGVRLGRGVRQRGHRDVRRQPRGGRAGGTGRPQYQGVEIHGTGGAALYELIHPFQLQLSLGPAMARRQHWATVEVPPDFAVYPGSPRNPRADDPLVAYKYDQGVAFVRAIHGETTDYPTFRDGADVQGVVDAVDLSARERRWVEVDRTLMRAQVVVIGGGAFGASCFYHLSARGVRDVVLLEQATLGSGSTGRSAAVVETQYLAADQVALCAWSIRLFRRLEAEHGLPFTHHGYLRLAHTADVVAQFHASVAMQREHGLTDARVLEPAEVTKVVPALRVDDLAGALWGPSDGYVDAVRYCEVLTGLGRAAGGRVLQGRRATGVRLSGGRVTAVLCDGEAIDCETVVNASGAWARRLGAALGSTCPWTATGASWSSSSRPDLWPRRCPLSSTTCPASRRKGSTSATTRRPGSSRASTGRCTATGSARRIRTVSARRSTGSTRRGWPRRWPPGTAAPGSSG